MRRHRSQSGFKVSKILLTAGVVNRLRVEDIDRFYARSYSCGVMEQFLSPLANDPCCSVTSSATSLEWYVPKKKKGKLKNPGDKARKAAAKQTKKKK